METTASPNRDENAEKVILERRKSAIRDLLIIPSLEPIFIGLPQNPAVLDLFTGTGAGASVVYDVLVNQGKRPNSIVTVDTYEQHSPSVMEDAKYAMGVSETKRNLSGLETDVQVIDEDVSAYIRSLQTHGNLPFDLIIGFSVPVGSQKPVDIIDVLHAFNTNTAGLFTFGSRAFEYVVRNLIPRVRDEGFSKQWRFYTRPHERHHSTGGWDETILTNKGLDLPNLS